mgnify:CR=1 FL=1
MSVQFSNPDGVFVPLAFSQLLTVWNETLLILSGQVAFAADGQMVGEGNLRVQTEQIFKNIQTILLSAEATMGDILKLTIYVVNYQPDDRFVIADVQRMFIVEPFPASTLLGVQSLARPGLLIEIDVLAKRPFPTTI